MNQHTVTAAFTAPPEEVFTYLADIEKLPDWATEFARELRLVDGHYKVVNGLGEFFFELRADPESGVIDMLAGPDREHLLRFPARVVATPVGGSAVIFTMFQAPGQPDDQFENQHASLLREFDNLEQRFNRLENQADDYADRGRD